MKKISVVLSCFVLAAAISGCKSTKVVDQNQIVTEILPKPSTIYVYNFVADPKEIPKDCSGILKKAAKDSPVMTKENIEIGKKLGASIAEKLITNINTMGLTAEMGRKNSKPKPNDIVLRGYLISVNQGNTAKRFAIGLGLGGSQLSTVVEGYQMTENGLRKLGETKLRSGGSKTPGGGVGALSFIAGGNPLGLIIGGSMKAYGEVSGSARIEGRAKDTAKAISDKIREKVKQMDWID